MNNKFFLAATLFALTFQQALAIPTLKECKERIDRNISPERQRHLKYNAGISVAAGTLMIMTYQKEKKGAPKTPLGFVACVFFIGTAFSECYFIAEDIYKTLRNSKKEAHADKE